MTLKEEEKTERESVRGECGIREEGGEGSREEVSVELAREKSYCSKKKKKGGREVGVRMRGRDRERARGKEEE